MTGKRPKICLMGVSYSTGNLGVAALAEGAIQGILAAADDAEITIVSDGEREASTIEAEHGGRRVEIKVLPIRYGKTVWKLNHVGMLYFQTLLSKPGTMGTKGMRRRIIDDNPLLRALDESDAVADMSGGDSFTDIYGPWRMFLQTLFKCLVIFAGKRLVLLPQTIGPFGGRLSRAAARFILKRAARVYTRDVEGIEETRRIAGSQLGGRLRFAPDVGFLVEAKEPERGNLASLLREKARTNVLVGINVSGLLMSGGYTRGNQFGLKGDYKGLHVELARRFLAEPGAYVVFVPHVIRERGHVEDDVTACEAVRAELDEGERGRTLVVDCAEARGVREMKWVIGQCAFFVGSRMHSCIAALSQGVPAVGAAYSRKFRGVFETMGVGEMAADLRGATNGEIVALAMTQYGRREETRGNLVAAAAEVKRKIGEVFEDLCRGAQA